MYSIGATGFILGSGLATLGSPEMIVLGLVLNSLATVVTFVCFNAYVRDYMSRIDLGKCETLGSRLIGSEPEQDGCCERDC